MRKPDVGCCSLSRANLLAQAVLHHFCKMKTELLIAPDAHRRMRGWESHQGPQSVSRECAGQNVRKLVKDGFVIRKPVKIHSRARARAAQEAKSKGRHTGYGEFRELHTSANLLPCTLGRRFLQYILWRLLAAHAEELLQYRAVTRLAGCTCTASLASGRHAEPGSLMLCQLI